MQNIGFEQTTTKFMESFVAKEYFFLGKAVMETISVAITGSSNMHCLDIYLTNIFTESIGHIESLPIIL